MSGEEEPEQRARRPMQRLGELLPEAARRLGLEEELALAQAMTAWQAVVAERLPQAAGECRLVSLDRGVASIEADVPIVGQEIRLRSIELLGALRARLAGHHVETRIVELRVAIRHV